jgi:hypothetical protein
MSGSPDSDLDFLRPSGQSGKGVGGARVCALHYCSIAKWSWVAKWVNTLLDTYQITMAFKFATIGQCYKTILIYCRNSMVTTAVILFYKIERQQ